MNKILIVLLLFSTSGLFAQNMSDSAVETEIEKLKDEVQALHGQLDTIVEHLSKKLTSLQLKNNSLSNEIHALNERLVDTRATLDTLEGGIEKNSREISDTKSDMGGRIQDAEKASEKRISAVDRSLSKNSLYAIIGILLAILFSILFFWLVNKRQKTDRSAILEEVNRTKASLEESMVKEFGKQTELMESQMELLKEQNAAPREKTDLEPDHSLALKLAGEINLIERNLSLMDEKTRGLKQLNRSVEKLKDNLAANGYEMPVLLGKPFNEGMKVTMVNSIPDENLEKGTEVITKVLIPQVNYNDKMIQIAQVEVSVGY
ncbi:MAG: septum formation initiator [Lewinellaceae bacterium]|nr:septum formation initiator [Lewinellaceae bacterium]